MNPLFSYFSRRYFGCVLGSLLWIVAAGIGPLCNTAAAQDNFYLKGFVKDAADRKTGVKDVEVRILGTGMMDGTKDHGEFSISISREMIGDPIKLEITKPGWQSVIKDYVIQKNQSKELLTIYLRSEKPPTRNKAESADLVKLMKMATQLQEDQQHEQSLLRFEEALTIIRKRIPRLKDKEMECLIQSSWLQMALGKYDRSQELLKEAEAIATTTAGSDKYRARIARVQGDLMYTQGENPRASLHYENARKLFHKVGDKAGEAQALIGLGNLARSRSQYDDSREYFRQALKLFSDIKDPNNKDPLGEAHALLGWGTWKVPQVIT